MQLLSVSVRTIIRLNFSMHTRDEKLQAAIDRIRGKFGDASVQSATVMGAKYKKKQNPFGDKPSRWDKNNT